MMLLPFESIVEIMTYLDLDIFQQIFSHEKQDKQDYAYKLWGKTATRKVHIYEHRIEYRTNGVLHSRPNGAGATIIWNNGTGYFYRCSELKWDKAYKPFVHYSNKYFEHIDVTSDDMGFINDCALSCKVPKDYPLYGRKYSFIRDPTVSGQHSRFDYYHLGKLHNLTETKPAIDYPTYAMVWFKHGVSTKEIIHEKAEKLTN